MLPNCLLQRYLVTVWDNMGLPTLLERLSGRSSEVRGRSDDEVPPWGLVELSQRLDPKIEYGSLNYLMCIG